MQIRTASDLKYMYQIKGGGHFFDRKTLKFFGDAMSNYYVPVKNGSALIVDVKQSDGEIAQCYVLQRRKPVKHNLTSSAYFQVDTFALITGEVQN